MPAKLGCNLLLTRLQREYQPTAKVLDHFNYEINERLGGIDDGTGKKVPAKIALLAGADLVETFSQPGVWSAKDLSHILCDYGAFIIERAGTNLDEAMEKLEPRWRERILVIHQVRQFRWLESSKEL